MPIIDRTEIGGFAWCARLEPDGLGFCDGNEQQPVRLIREDVSWLRRA